MLFQIQKELSAHKKNTQLLSSVERDISVYKKLKKEYEELSDATKKKLTNQFKIYLLLVSIGYNEISFSNAMILMHNYEKMGITEANLALGRFYSKCSICFSRYVIDNLLPLFEQGKLLRGYDLQCLLKALFELAQHKTYDRVLRFCLERFPDSLMWKIHALNYQVDLSHKYPENQEMIVSNLKYLHTRCTKAEEFCRIALCFYNAGYFQDAVNMYNMAIQKLVPIVEQSGDFTFNSARCLASMNNVIDKLDKLGVKAFPAFGSLLGLVRDGKFMEYDKDSDIGIFVENYEQIYDILEKLCESPNLISPEMENKSKDSHTWTVPVFDNALNTATDLFFFYRAPTHIEAGLYTKCGILKWQFTPFELVQRELAGKNYWVPENAEQHLTELYADWTQPVEVWDSLLNCPNLMQTSQKAVIFFGLMRLYHFLNEGKTKKALNYYQTLTTRWGMRFSPEADANIRKLLGLN